MVPSVARGTIRALFLYDVADTIDLGGVPAALGGRGLPAPLQLRPEAASGFIQFATVPIVVPRFENFQAKIFDYGVISLSLNTPFEGSWETFMQTARKMRRDEALATASDEELKRLLNALEAVLDEPHAPIFEDYFIFEVQQFTQPITAAALLGDHRAELARLITCEDRPLATKELDDVLRVSFSYYDDDLVVVEWENAFVYDSNPGQVADILEFANTQLVELRTYDSLLDGELDRIYKSKPLRPAQWIWGRGFTRWAEQLRFLIVDVRELLDRSGNALKFIGDAYFARLYRGTAARLGIEDWQRQIDAKLRSISDMYRFAEDRAQHARDNLLEVIIILLIVAELIIGVAALRR